MDYLQELENTFNTFRRHINYDSCLKSEWKIINDENWNMIVDREAYKLSIKYYEDLLHSKYLDKLYIVEVKEIIRLLTIKLKSLNSKSVNFNHNNNLSKFDKIVITKALSKTHAKIRI